MTPKRLTIILVGCIVFLAVCLAVSLVFNFLHTNSEAAPPPEVLPETESGETAEITVPALEIIRANYYRWDNSVSLQFNAPVNAYEFQEYLQCEPELNGLNITYEYDPVTTKLTLFPQLEPDTMYRITVKAGLREADGIGELAKDYNINIVTEPERPEFKLLTSGRILPPGSSVWSLPFSFRKLESVDIVLYEGYANNQHSSPAQSFYMSRKIAEKSFRLPPAGEDGTGYFELDLAELVPEREPGFYVLSVEGEGLWGQTYPLTVSDIGISAAVSGGKAMISVHSLADGTPLEGAMVQLISSKNQELAAGESDAGGNVVLWFEHEEDPEDYPDVVKVYYLNDCNTLPVDFRNRLDISEFALAGADEYDMPHRIKVHPVRDVMRPGESLGVMLFVRDAVTGGAPGAVPVGVAVYDANGKLLQRELLECSETGFASFDISLAAGAMQGNYTVYAGTPGSEMENCCGYADILVAEFKPDTIKVELDKGDDGNGTVAGYAGYYFGQAAKEANVTVLFSGTGERFAPEGFEGYVFGVPGNGTLSRSSVNGKVAENGRFSFLLPPLNNDGPVNTVIRQKAEVTVTAPASRPVTAVKEILRYPDRNYLGTMVSAAGNDAFTVKWVSVDGTRAPVPMDCDRFEWTLERVEWEYSFVESAGGRIERQWVERFYPEADGTVDIGIGMPEGEFVIPCPASGNNFRLTVTDPVDGLMCQREISLANEDAGIRSRNRMVVPFVSDAAEYLPGTQALITFELDAPGAVTVMTDADDNNEIFEMQGVAGTNVFAYTIPEEMVSGAVRLAFTVLVPDPEGNNEMRRSFGIASLKVDQSGHRLDIESNIPAETVPAGKLEIPLQITSGGEPADGCEVRVWAVNSALLALSGRTDAAFFEFFHGARENLWSFYDCFSELYPPYSLKTSSLPGGDGFRAALNRFSGQEADLRDSADIIALPVVTDAEGKCTVVLDIPDVDSCEYTLFAVAGNEDSIGDEVGRFLVRRKITPVLSVPSAVAGEDTFSVVLEIFNHKSADNELLWLIDCKGPAEVVSGELAGTANVAAGESFTAEVVLKAERGGDGRCAFTAAVKNSEDLAVTNCSTIVRPAALPESRFAAAVIPAGGSLEIAAESDELITVDDATVSIGSGPAANLGSRLQWLGDYPYGCSEQIISRSLPLLAVNTLVKSGVLPESFVAGTEDTLRQTFDILRARQNDGIKMWDGDTVVDWDVSVFTGFLLVTAAERGYELPEDMLDNLCKSLERYVFETGGRDALERRAFAGLVLAKAGVRCAPRLKLLAYEAVDAGNQNFALALAGYALYAAGEAEDGLRFFKQGMAHKPWVASSGYSCWSSSVRRMGILLAAAVEMMPEDEMTIGLAVELEKINISDSATTQEMAWSTFALAEYAGTGGAEAAAFTVQDLKGSISYPAGGSARYELAASEKINIVNDGPGDIAVTTIIRGTGENKEEIAEGISITRRFLDEDGREITSARRGDLFTMEIVLASTSGYQSDIVIAALLPGGIEAEDVRFATRAGNRSNAPRRSELLADRVLIFDNASPEGTVINIPVRATTGGRFIVPPVVAEDMYDPSVRAVCPAGAELFEVKNIVPETSAE